MKPITALGAATAALLLASAAQANTVDQSDYSGSAPAAISQSTHVVLIGQTFTPSLDSLDYVTFAAFNADFASNAAPSSLEVQLYQGDDPDGTGAALATSGVSVLSASHTASNLEFDFAHPVSLVAGNVYTFLIRDLNKSDTGSAIFETGDIYPGGNLVQSGGDFVSGDTYFSEGLRDGSVVSSAPEPGTWALMFVGVAAAGLMLRLHHWRQKARIAT